MDTQRSSEISVEEFASLQKSGEDYFLLDVREPFEYEICHIHGYLIPLQELPQRMQELDNTKNIIVHCKSGGR